MSTRSVFRIGFFAATLWAVTACGQEPQWTHGRRVNRASGRESDVLVIRGHYLTPLPPSHDEGTPTLSLSCSVANLDAIVIATGVAIDNEFGASPKVHAQIDDGPPMWDRAVLALRLRDDSKNLTFTPHNSIGGTDMLFARKYVVTVESEGKRIVAMEFELPSDSSAILRYCGLMKPKPPKS